MPNPTDGTKAALTGEDLAQQEAAALPEREAMSTISGSGVDNFAVPINEALAVNVDSDYSYAIADADQIVVLNQVDVDGVDDTSDDAVIDDKHAWKDK